MFQTRFCYRCLIQGMDLEQENVLNSPYALIPTLFRIKATYDDIAIDIERAILKAYPKQRAKPVEVVNRPD